MSYCEYCLKECVISGKLCNKFKKGAYLSKERQTLDWSPNGTGQRHFHWCAKRDYVEEDCLDWILVPIPNKGFGLQYKNILREKFKILTASVYTEPDGLSGIIVLVTEEASLQANVSTDCLPSHPERDSSNYYAVLLLSRADHDCRKKNTRHVYDEMD